MLIREKRKKCDFSFFSYLSGTTASLSLLRAAGRADADFCRQRARAHARGELTPAERRDLRTTPLSALRAAQPEFSSLRSSRQGAMAVGALCLPPCPLRLPLLFPKNLAALRFSGALFIFQGTPLSNAAQIHLSCISLAANWVRGRKSAVLLARGLFSEILRCARLCRAYSG